MRLKNMSKIISILILCAAVLLGFAQGQTQSQTGSPPEILEITFPSTIQADGEEYKGRILFKDADGDAERGDLRIIKAEDPQSIIINGQTPEDNLVSLEIKSPPEKQKEGQGIILLKISTTTPQEVKIQLILVDKAGNESEPGEFSFRARGNIPDLVVSLGDLPPEVYVAQEVEVSYAIQNIGGGDAGPFRVGVYLSRDSAITTDDLLLGSQEISGLASDVSAAQSLRVKLTQELLSRGGLQPGPLFLGVIADDLNQVEESDEANNAASSTIQIYLYTICPGGCVFTRIQEAIDTAKSGDTITIGPGTYEENLEITKSLTLRGAGREQTIIKSKEKQKPVILIESDSEVVIEALTVTMAKYEDGNGIRVKDRAKIVIQNSEVSRNDENGLYVSDFAIAIIKNSTFSGNRDDGLYVEGSGSVTVENSFFRNAGDGLSVRGSASVTVEGSTFLGEYGLSVGESASVTVKNSTFSESWRLLSVGGSASVVIKNSTFSESSWGLSVHNSASMTIENSQIFDIETAGIFLEDNAKANISNNEIFNNKWYGVAFWQRGCVDSSVSKTFIGKVEGSGNEIYNNGRNLCPSDCRYWPSGFGGGC